MGVLIEALESARAQRTQAHAALEQQREFTAHLKRLVEKASRSGPHVLATMQAQLEEAQERLRAAKSAVDAADAASQLAYTQLAEARMHRRADRVMDIVERLHLDSDIQLRPTWDAGLEGFIESHWELVQLETDEHGARVLKPYEDEDGVERHYPVQKRTLMVYGPLRNTRLGRWETPARVSWGGVNTLGVAEARELLAVYEIAVKLAEYLDAHADAWLAEDSAD